MRELSGFTLLEVVVAGGLLSVGILALITLQAQALHAQNRVRVVRELVSVAEGQLERSLAAAAPGDLECVGTVYANRHVDECRVVTEACHMAEPACGGKSASRAVRVTVTVSGDSRQSFELSAISARFGGP